MKSKKYYWKVVSVINGNEYVSAISRSAGLNLKYAINTWTKPSIGKIFVFKTRESARRYIYGNSSGTFKIFKCEVKNPVPAKYMSYYTWYLDIRDFWTTGPIKGNHETVLSGTYYVDECKLIEKVS